MGSTLIVTIVSDESIPREALRRVDPSTGLPVPLKDTPGYLPPSAWADLLRKHADAVWLLPVPHADAWGAWGLPQEPPDVERPEVEAEHVEVCRRSLEEFINARLAELEGMLRSGIVLLPRMCVRVEIRVEPGGGKTG